MMVGMVKNMGRIVSRLQVTLLTLGMKP
jgi:hypothetical protein